jgi:hypothetical protein
MPNKGRMIRIPDPLWEKVEAEAKERGESVSAAVRRFFAQQYVKGKG